MSFARRSRGVALTLVLGASFAFAAEGDDSSGASLTQALDADSGVSVQAACTNCNNADLTVGGLGSEHVAVTCDGLPVPSGLPQVYLFTVMPGTSIDRVAVVRGASDVALAGSAIGGGIDIERYRARPGFALATSADAGGYGWAGARVDLSGGWEPVRGTLLASFATSDPVDADGDGNFDLGGFERTAVEGRLDVRPARRHRIDVGFASYDESQEDAQAAYDAFGSSASGEVRYNLENVELERRQADLRYEFDLPDGSTLEVTGLVAERAEDIEETLRTDVPEVQFVPTYFIDEDWMHVGASWARPIGAHLRVSAGAAREEQVAAVVDVLYNAIALGLPPDQWTEFGTEETRVELGAWAEGAVELGERWQLAAGVRWVEHSYEDQEDVLVALVPSREPWLELPLPEGDRWLPRAAVTYKPADAWTLRATAGAGLRQPASTYNEVCCGRRFSGNRGLTLERSEAYGLEIVYQPGPDVRASAVVSTSDFDGFVQKYATLTYGFRPTYQNVNVPEARVSSVSLEGRWSPAERVQIKGALTWLDADNRTPDGAVPVIVDFFNTPTPYTFTVDQLPYLADRHASLGAQVRAGAGFAVGATAQYTGSMWIQGFDDDPSTPGILGSETLEELFETDAFWSLGARVDKAFSKGLSAYLGVDNLTDEVQSDLGNPERDYDWGLLRGRYWYGGLAWRYGPR